MSNTTPKVLIADTMSPLAQEVFARRGIATDVHSGLSNEQLCALIGEYHGLAVRSATKVTAQAIAGAEHLKVIGRAGIGVDNIDIAAATRAGIAVMNTPTGNAITTAEHAIAMMFALARELPAANASTHAGKWEKSRFMGVELFGKTLGLIGCGNIGTCVAQRAVALGMRVMAHDPYLTEERAAELGVKRCQLGEVLAQADFITLHVPLTEKTRNILGAEELSNLKQGAYVINCARGGLVDETALLKQIDGGKIAGAGFDVYASEPARTHPFFGHPKIICTPHLGASTHEAQDKSAAQVAEQMADMLLDGAIVNTINFPPVSASDRARLAPYLELMELMGIFLGQLVNSAVQSIHITHTGDASSVAHPAAEASLAAGLLTSAVGEINMISARDTLQRLGVQIIHTTGAPRAGYVFTVQVTVTCENGTSCAEGTLFGNNDPRIVSLQGVEIESTFGEHMIYVANQDTPGLVGALGTLLSQRGINIASFALGRDRPRGIAQVLVHTDTPIDDNALAEIKALPQVQQAQTLTMSRRSR